MSLRIVKTVKRSARLGQSASANSCQAGYSYEAYPEAGSCSLTSHSHPSKSASSEVASAASAYLAVPGTSVPLVLVAVAVAAVIAAAAAVVAAAVPEGSVFGVPV